MTWTATEKILPRIEDWDGTGKVLIWDVNNGCMIGKKERQRDMLREPVTHWQPIPRNWIPKSEKMPNIFDADAQGCVLALDMMEGARIIGYNNPTIHTERIVGWQRLPKGPGR